MKKMRCTKVGKLRGDSANEFYSADIFNFINKVAEPTESMDLRCIEWQLTNRTNNIRRIRAIPAAPRIRCNWRYGCPNNFTGSASGNRIL
jgi:hypothetical protein